MKNNNHMLVPKLKKGSIVLYRGRRVGLFASYAEIIGLLDICERRELQVRVDIAFGYYCDINHPKGKNWWNYYFEPIEPVVKDDTVEVHAFARGKGLRLIHHARDLPRKRKNELISKYIKLLPEMQEEVDTFDKMHDLSRCPAIHYRGTDKVKEGAILFPPQYAIKKINAVIEEEDWRVFVATDSQSFLDKMREQLGHHRVISTVCTRSDNQAPVHIGNKEGMQVALGKESVMDCYLLSKSSTFFCTESNLSNSVKAINIRSKVTNLTREYQTDEKGRVSGRLTLIKKKLAGLGLTEEDIVSLRVLLNVGGVNPNPVKQTRCKNCGLTAKNKLG